MHFNIAVLCHTVSRVNQALITEALRKRQPGIAVIRLTARRVTPQILLAAVQEALYDGAVKTL